MVLKCDDTYLAKVDKKDIVSYKKNKYDCQILVENRDKMSKKYNDCVIDKISLEDLMVLIIKGERV